MAQAAVAAEVHQPLDIHGDVAPEVAFDHVVAVDNLADLHDLRLGQLADPALRRDSDLGADMFGEGIADAMNVSEGHLDPFVGRDVHACNSGHVVVSSRTANVLKLNPDYPIGTQQDRPRTGITPGTGQSIFQWCRVYVAIPLDKVNRASLPRFSPPSPRQAPG